MPTQLEKAQAFRALHHRDHPFLIPNPWDQGSAHLLAQLGFEALATTSAGFAFSAALTDNAVTREAMLAHIQSIAAATPLPVNADLQNGFGHSPETAAETIRLAIDAGAAGGSIEDASQDTAQPIYPIEQATDRIRAAAEAAHSGPIPFLLTARCENYLFHLPDLADTIARLESYQQAGADVLYAPGLTDPAEISTLVRSLDRPVNLLAGVSSLTVAQIAALGVRRISVGSALARAAYAALLHGATEMLSSGSFTFSQQATPFSELNHLFSLPPIPLEN